MRKKFMVLTALSLFALVGLTACKGDINKEHNVQEVEISTEQNTDEANVTEGEGMPFDESEGVATLEDGQGVSEGESDSGSISVGEDGEVHGYSHSEGTGEDGDASFGVTQGESSSNSFSATSDVIGEDKALEIALEKAGLSKDQVTDISVEADADAGTDKYEVEFKKGNKEYNYDIDMHDGTVYESEAEMDD